MSRCVIIAGAAINTPARIKKYLKADDYFIFCDSGLRHRVALGVNPDLIVGDFDSHPRPDTDLETIVLPREKDDTDSVYAVKEALRRGFDDFLLLGMIGARMDHSLGNVSILLYLHQLGKTALIVDDYSEMEIVDESAKYVEDNFPYFSLLSLWGDCSGVYVKNAKFPLENANITGSYQYGISNEVLPGMRAEVHVDDGLLLLVKVLPESC